VSPHQLTVSSASVGAVPYFFLSYSRKDAPDGFLYKFYDDLCRELPIRGGPAVGPVDSIGFLDRDQQPGINWASATSEALATCKVFVPVYSPNYFSSSYCGKEWHAFSRRLAIHEKTHDNALASIVPCRWVRLLEEPPQVTRFIQDTRDQFGSEYRGDGLRFLMQLKENESKYKDFLVKFTYMLVAAGARQSLDPLAGIDLLTEVDAFAVEAKPVKTAENRFAREIGMKHVTFVVAAASRDEMEGIRATVDVYGDDWTDWRPYHPSCPDPIVLRAQGVAGAQRMIARFDPIGEELFQLLERAQERNEVVVIIVDPWAVGLDEYRRLLKKLDSLRFRTTAVVVPWEPADTIEAKVRDALYLCLANWAESGEPAFRQDIRSIEEFEKILGQVMIEIRSRILRWAEVARRVQEEGPRTRPILANPAG
jgi:FxsC-like protein